MKQPHMASTSHAAEEDVRKKGYLLKVKTSKKKYFVVRDESSSGPARLEYYDNDKKFRSGGLARRCILLKNCFSINAKSESTRHRHMIVLYTEDDCFGIACDSESDQMDWLNTMVQLRSHSMNVSCRSPASFKHVWPVSVEAIDGKNILVIPGSYRLCLAATNLTLIPLWSLTQSEIVIPLDSIRCCGHGESLLLVELDRSSMVDQGELWLQADDALIARSIHDTLVSMLQGQTAVSEPFRARSKTSCAGDIGGDGTVSDARRAVSRRLQALRATAAPHRMTGSVWSQSLETLIKEGKSSGTNYFVMNPGSSVTSDPSAPCDSGYIEMKPPTKFIGYVDMSCGRQSTAGQNQIFAAPSSAKHAKAGEGYMDMMPRVGSLSVSPDSATQLLASRLEVVRSYVQKDSESGDDNSDESSVASLAGSDEHLPKERAYSVGCRPPMIGTQLRLHAGYATSHSSKAPGKTSEKSSEVSKRRHQDTSSSRSRKISATSRTDHLHKQSADTGSSKSLPGAKVASDLDPEKTDHGTVEGTIRPRTSTLPWNLLRETWNSCDDPLRPRSSSGGNAASIRDAVRSRIASSHHSSLLTTRLPSHQRPELVCPAEGQETGEYVEMHCPAAS